MFGTFFEFKCAGTFAKTQKILRPIPPKNLQIIAGASRSLRGFVPELACIHAFTFGIRSILVWLAKTVVAFPAIRTP